MSEKTCAFASEKRLEADWSKDKVATARTLWVPAVNNYGGFGSWEFIEITDPWQSATLIRSAIISRSTDVTPFVTRRTTN